MTNEAMLVVSRDLLKSFIENSTPRHENDEACARERRVLRDKVYEAAPVMIEPAAWQFLHEGKWYNGDDRIKDHRKNTVEAGYSVRELFAGQPLSLTSMLPDDWEDQLFAEMSRRFDLRKQIDDDHMVYDDTQIGVEFARDWVKARLSGVKP